MNFMPLVINIGLIVLLITCWLNQDRLHHPTPPSLNLTQHNGQWVTPEEWAKICPRCGPSSDATKKEQVYSPREFFIGEDD